MTNLTIMVSTTVYVLGAGFTKAFLPDAPLLKDHYGTAQLAETFERFSYSSRPIDLERNRLGDGRIDIERLLSRLDGKMPYDFERGVTTELNLLRTAVQKCLSTASTQPRRDTSSGIRRAARQKPVAAEREDVS